MNNDISKYKNDYIEENSAFSKLFRNVYIWMTLALTVTGITAFYAANYFTLHPMLLTTGLILTLGIVELAIVVILSAYIEKLSFPVAGIMFMIYSVINGVTLSVILLAYTLSSIASAFFVTAGTFAAMALIGTFTKMDLSKYGSLLFMALIGLIIASVVNIFWANSTLYWIVTYVGVLVFVGLTAYDAQKIKNMLKYQNDDEHGMKISLLGSLSLYLDFINLFIYILRIVGNRNS